MGVVLLFCFNPEQSVWMPKCPFKLLVGLSCPGCGVQRAVHAALHGHFLAALRYNYFLALTGPYAFFLILEKWVLPIGRFQHRLERFCEHRITVCIYLVAFCLWFVLRNVFGV